MQSIYTKKLSYALTFDKADDIEEIFRAVRDGDWKNLTCTNIFRVQQKVNKGRKIEQKSIKTLTKAIIDDTQKEVERLVKNCFTGSSEGRYEEREDRREDRRQYRRREEERQERAPRREERAPRMESQRVQEPRFNNGYPTVKISKIPEIDSHFNIILKVVDVHKEFKIGTGNKIEFLGGDETGICTVVIDK